MTINASAPYKPVASILQPASNKIQTVLNYDKIQEAHVLTLSLTINGFLATSQFILCRRKMQVDRQREVRQYESEPPGTQCTEVCGLCVCVYECATCVLWGERCFSLSLFLYPHLSPRLSPSLWLVSCCEKQCLGNALLIHTRYRRV